MGKFTKALVMGDLHIRWQHKRAVDLTLRIAKDLGPDVIVLDGDVIDCWEISRFDKDPRFVAENKLAGEIEDTRAFLADLRRRFPKARIVYIFGNHEHRWGLFIARQASELHGLKGLSLAEQLECREAGIEVVYSGNRESSWQWGKLLIGHFDRVHKASSYTAKNLLDDKGISLIQGHTHRGGSSYKRAWDRDLVAFENFCLCDRSPSYADRPNWQLGFSVVYKDAASDYFYVEPHPVAEIRHGGKSILKAFFNGECYVG